LSAPFCSRGFRWNVLSALARFFAARSCPVQLISLLSQKRVTKTRTRDEEHDNQAKDCRFRQYQEET
jgi:hypothetical protein